MAIEIISEGDVVLLVDGGFVDGQPAVYGGTTPIWVSGSWVPDVDDGRFDADGDWTGDSGHVYAGLTTGDLTILGGYIEDLWADVFGPEIYIIPARSYRRIQLDGGGRLLFEAWVGDEASERFFELWRNGRPFPLFNVSNPIFSWRSPSGAEDEEPARIVDPHYGRVGVHLPFGAEAGTWLVQVRYPEEINLDSNTMVPDGEPPYAPVPGAQEFWRYLPKALRCITRSEGGF